MFVNVSTATDRAIGFDGPGIGPGRPAAGSEKSIGPRQAEDPANG